MLKKRLLITYTVLIAFFLLFILTIVNQAVSDTIDAQMEHVTIEALEVGVRSVNKLFSDILSETLNVCVDHRLQSAMIDYQAVPYDDEKEQTLIWELERAVTNLRKKLTIECAFIYPMGANGMLNPVMTGDAAGIERDLNMEDWVLKTIEKDGQFLLTEGSGQGKTCVRLSKLILSDTKDQKHLGVLEIQMDVQVLSNLLNQITMENGSVYLLDEEGRILLPYAYYHQDGNEKFGELRSTSYINHHKKMVIVRPLYTIGWRVAADVPMSAIMQKSVSLRIYVLLASVVAIAAAMLLAVYFASRISRPVLKLSGIMNQVREGNLDIRIDTVGQKGEMNALYHSFNYMMDMIRDLIEEVYVAKIKEKQSELAALQAQINPHFLYNTLDSINWMAMRYGAEDIQRMVISLAAMLRYSLNNGQNFITVEDEIKQVNSYIQLQQIRFDGCFESDIQIEDGMECYVIIKLLLQPLVENAIMHGFGEGQLEHGHLYIRGSVMEGHMVFCVMNDGDQADLRVIRDILYPEEYKKPKSYGIRNVNDRLMCQYGEEYRLNYTIENQLTVVTFRIPVGRYKDVGEFHVRGDI